MLKVDMKIPKRCGACPCRHVEFDIDRVAVFCAIMDNLFVEDPDSIPSWCPINGELVLCKDCEHFYDGGNCTVDFDWIFGLTENDYCSRAERKEK